MKILHLLYSGLGGHGNVFFSMIAAADAADYQFEAIFTGVEPLREEYKERCIAGNIPFLYISKAPGKHYAFFKKIYHSIRQSDADIVFLHGSTLVPAVWLAKKTGNRRRKIIVRETQAIHLKSKAEVFSLKGAMRLADNIVLLSNEYKIQLEKDLGRKFNKQKVSVIPNGIDLATFKQVQKIHSDNTIVIGMQSRIVAIKDHETLLAAFSNVLQLYPEKRMVLKLAGDGENLSNLKDLAQKLGISNSVIFEGMLAEAALPDFLNSLDIYIHASFGETMSTAIMQAMACAKAIIASDVDGINNMIYHEKTGLLVPVKNVEMTTNAIKRLVDNPSEKTALENEALAFAKAHYSNKTMFDRYAVIFQQ